MNKYVKVTEFRVRSYDSLLQPRYRLRPLFPSIMV
jgi:hypothetical protein